jgi:predicted metal-dependent phosphoesterase TrpH
LRIKADFHTHSIGEGRFGALTTELVARHVEAAVEAGLDCVAVTDHDDIRPGLLAEEYVAKKNLPILLLPGIEITTTDGHLLAIGVREPIAGWRPLETTIPDIRALGGLVILPHPFFAHLRARVDVDAFERFNSRYGDFTFETEPVALVADSDAHNATELLNSKYNTLIDLESLTIESVADAVRAGRTYPNPRARPQIPEGSNQLG